MDRCTTDEANQETVDAQAAELASYEDLEVPDPEDRRNRETVAYYADENDGWSPSVLKRNDDVDVFGVFKARVIGPGPGRHAFYVHYQPYFGSAMFLITDLTYITDRAPLDTNETPMPLIPEPAMQAMMARGAAAPVDPKAAAKTERSVVRVGRRDEQQNLRELVQAQEPEVAKKLRDVLRRAGKQAAGE